MKIITTFFLSCFAGVLIGILIADQKHSVQKDLDSSKVAGFAFIIKKSGDTTMIFKKSQWMPKRFLNGEWYWSMGSDGFIYNEDKVRIVPLYPNQLNK